MERPVCASFVWSLIVMNEHSGHSRGDGLALISCICNLDLYNTKLARVLSESALLLALHGKPVGRKVHGNPTPLSTRTIASGRVQTSLFVSLISHFLTPLHHWYPNREHILHKMPQDRSPISSDDTISLQRLQKLLISGWEYNKEETGIKKTYRFANWSRCHVRWFLGTFASFFMSHYQ